MLFFLPICSTFYPAPLASPSAGARHIAAPSGAAPTAFARTNAARKSAAPLAATAAPRKRAAPLAAAAAPPKAPAARHFLVLCHDVGDAVARGEFSANNLLEGRVDVLARCLTAALWVSNGVREDATLWLCLGRDTVEIRGADVRGLNPDEKTAALFLRRALAADQPDAPPAKAAAPTGKSQRNLDRLVARRRVAKLPSPPGFVVRRGERFEDRLDALGGGPYVLLHEAGGAWSARAEARDAVVVIADQLGFSDAEDAFFAADARATRVSFGAASLLTSQCIVLAHHYLDTGA